MYGEVLTVSHTRVLACQRRLNKYSKPGVGLPKKSPQGLKIGSLNVKKVFTGVQNWGTGMPHAENALTGVQKCPPKC
jgi:hypothetical protein